MTRSLANATPLSDLYRYRTGDVMFSPKQLFYLCECLERTRDLDGPVAEVGCFRGATTVFLCRYMDEIRHPSTYYAYDTFSGFTALDIEYEIKQRNKLHQRRSMVTSFLMNDRRWFQKTLDRAGIQRARTIQADVNRWDFTELSDTSFCLIDVDLYRPVRAALEKIYPLVAPGGIILVDDCVESHPDFDAAYRAYCDFTSHMGIKPAIELRRFGFIQKAKT